MTSSFADREFDVCVFGASGFTGARICRRLGSVASFMRNNNERRVSWAVAGRSEAKVSAVLSEMAHSSGAAKLDLEHVGVIIADVADDDSLRSMCERTRVLINCVGPYRHFGLPVVRACVAAGTHYVDVTGEPEFMVRSELAVGDEAARKRLLVVHACGFDSVPADLGHRFAVELVRRVAPRMQCTAIYSYLTLDNPRSAPGHFATYESAVYGFANYRKLLEARRALAEHAKARGDAPVRYAPPPRAALAAQAGDAKKAWLEAEARAAMHYAKRLGARAFPFPGADAAVVRRSQQALAASAVAAERDAVQPRYSAFFTVRSLFYTIILGIFSACLRALAPYAAGRWLLLKAPWLFTFGWFSHAGPTKEQMDACSFRMRFFAEGRVIDEASGETPTDADAEIVCEVAGPEPGYVATPIIVVACAMTLLDELVDARSGRAKATAPVVGVSMPGASFDGSGLRDRLIKGGVNFTVVESNIKNNK